MKKILALIFALLSAPAFAQTITQPPPAILGTGGVCSVSASLTCAGPFISNGGTIVASAPGIQIGQTWNNVATTFTASLINVTDTASASGSLLGAWQIGGVSRFQIGKTTSSFGTNLTFLTDNTYDIGAGGANRPRAIYVAGVGVFGSQLTANGLSFQANGSIGSPSDGVIQLRNNAAADFTRLILGTNDASGVSLIKSGTTIVAGSGSGGSRADFLAASLYTTNSTVAALPAAATAGAGARRFVTDALTPVFGSAVTGGGAVACSRLQHRLGLVRRLK